MPKIIRNGITYTGLPDIDYDCEITTVTLYASNWSDGVYTITDSRIDSTTVQEYLPGLGVTDDQLAALQSANIHDNGQDNGHAYLKAYGDVPSIDIPIRIMFNPGVKTKEVEATIGTLFPDYSENGVIVNATSTATNLDFTATEDCYISVYCFVSSTSITLAVNGIIVCKPTVAGNYSLLVYAGYLKTGDRIVAGEGVRYIILKLRGA